MATYSTDLTTMNTMESATFTEFASPYNGGGSPGASGEQYIQGTDCYSQNTGKANGLEISCVYDYGSDISGTLGTDDVIFAWLFYFAGTNLETYTNGGWRFGIGSSTSAWDYFTVGGSDYGSHKYGGWFNFAVDPTATQTGTVGGGNGGAFRYFGNVPYTINEVTKGDPVAVDAIRYGRGLLSVTGSGSSFSELASYNDYNAGGTPPGTSSTTVDSGYHVLGLFQAAGGSYLWKGLLSFGVTATSVTFSDSNETIIIDDCPHTYAAFNKIEIHNSSSSVTWTNITFISTATTTVAKGRFEMVDNATVSLTGCSFNSMDTFIFDSNASLDACVFNGCGQITHGGADFEACDFAGYEGTAGTAYMTYAESVDPDGELDNCSFTKGTAATHAIEFDATNTPTTITLRGIDFSGYNASNGQNDSTLYFPSTTKSYTVNLIGCTGNISYRVGSGGSVTFVTDPVALTIEVDDPDGDPYQGARVLVTPTSSANFPYQASVSITGSGTTATVTHTGHGLSTNDYVVIEGVTNDDDYNGVYQITVSDANTYTYTASGTLGVSPAVGTLTATYAMISALTDVNGEVTNSWSLSANQPFVYKVGVSRATSPFYKGIENIANTIETTADRDIAVQLVSDE